MSYTVRLIARARRDLERIGEWVEDKAGRDMAEAYIDRVERRVATLSDFPNRGTPRRQYGEAVRSITFERRLLILYRVDGAVVRVVRVISASSDVQSLV